MVVAPVIRPAADADIMAAYQVFRRALFGYLHRLGMASEDEARDPPVASAWSRQEDWIRHLWSSASENWVAADGGGRIVGWAMSTDRDGHLELTHFFVDPACAGQGIGSALLARALPEGHDGHRTIVATQDPSALSVYLRAGLGFVTTSADVVVRAGPTSPSASLAFRRAGEADIDVIGNLDRAILGFRRDRDIAFLMENRPGWVAERDGRPVAYAFGAQPIPESASDHMPTCGPMAVLDAEDVAALLDHVIGTAPAGVDMAICLPMANGNALRHLLSRGGRIDPFYVAILSSDPGMAMDRYVHTSPSFIL